MVYDGISRLFGIALALVLAIIVDKWTDRNQKFPRLILLILGGFLLNELSLIEFGAKFIDSGDMEFVTLLVELTLSMVLFKEGLELDLKTFKEHLKPILILATFGIVISTSISAALIFLLTPMVFFLAVLISGLLAPTDPAATFSLFKGGLRIKPREKAIIGGESALNDAIAIVLVTTIFVKQAVENAFTLDYSIIISISSSFFGGIIFGYILGKIFLKINSRLDHYVQTNFISLALVLLTFTLSAYAHSFGLEISAAITALTAGAVFGNPQFFNTERFSQHHLHEFQSNFSELAELLAFVTLGMLMTPDYLGISIIIGIFLGIVAIISRAISILILSKWTRVSWKESIFISMGGMRGLATGVLAVIVIPELDHVFTTTITAEVFINSIMIALITTSAVQGLSIKFIGGKTNSLITADHRKELRVQRRVITSELSFYKKKLDAGMMSHARFEAITIPLYDELIKIKNKIESERKSKIKRVDKLLEEFEMVSFVLNDLIEYRDKVLIVNDRDDLTAIEKIEEFEKKEDELANQISLEIDLVKIRFDYITATEDKETGQVSKLICSIQDRIAGMEKKYNSKAWERLYEKVKELKINQEFDKQN